jgi:hypothetical protein
LAELGDPAKAPAMQACAKSITPFRGVAEPERSVLPKRVLAEHIPPDRVTYSATVLELWRTAEFREERYAATELSGEPEFFLPPGNRLGDCARTAPDGVRSFVDDHPDLSGLSRREALGHLGCGPAARGRRPSRNARKGPVSRPLSPSVLRGRQPRSVAPNRSPAAATAASRALVASSTVSVRSGARNRSL